jgi:DNA-binding HxlR family transcriptional regulator
MLRQLHAWGKWYGEQVDLEFDWMVSLGGRWTFWIWYRLLSGPKRFSELQKLLPPICQQVLSLELQKLEQMGVLHRQASMQRSTNREYVLTDLGRNSGPTLRQLYAWGRWICERLDLEYDWPVMDEAEGRACYQGIFVHQEDDPLPVHEDGPDFRSFSHITKMGSTTT